MEATAPPNPPAESPGGDVLLHPYIYPHSQLKVPIANMKKLEKLAQKGGETEKQARSFLASLEQARGAMATALESPSVSDAAVMEAVSTYLGLLLGLVAAAGGSSGGGATNGGVAAGAAAAASPDEALAAAEGGTSGASLLAAPPSRLRHVVQWSWSEAALAPPPGAAPRTAGASDALFELASVLVGAAIRLMHAAAASSADSASGVATPASTRSYKLLREAAGMLEVACKDVLPSLPGGLSADCDLQVVRGMSSVALADAQQLTFLRAVQKGNQPALIAALAADTAELFAQAGSQLGSAAVAGAGSCKLWQYSQYKQAYCLAYAHTFNGIALWKADKPGEGLKSLEAAAVHLAAAKRASGAYDAAPPASLNLHHRRVDEELERVLSDTQRRMQRENDTVYVQRVAAELAPLPAGKRLVSALPYALPPPAAAVREGVVERCFVAGPAPPAGAAAPMAAPAAVAMQGGGGGGGAAAATTAAAASGGDESREQGCSCCRWTAALIAMPVLCVLWCVGAVLWVLLLPLKCCCPCIGFPIQWAIDLVLWLLKLPARLLLWASGGGGSEGEGEKKQ